MYNNLTLLIKKKNRTVIGLLSGTSVDGVDTALVKFSGSGLNTRVRIADFLTHPIPPAVKRAILTNSDKKTAKIDEISRLNVIIAHIFADAVTKILKRNKLSNAQVDFIGSHGQTIHHLPGMEEYLGCKVKSTFQIGDPSVIANLTGITTIGDFRIADCAVSGDGAPLVPILDYILFSHKSQNRALLNIGGISNITVLQKGERKKDIFAFDTGPGNMLIDGMMYHLFRKPYDKNGMIAKKGVVNADLFNYLINDEVYQAEPPKSTGREHYGREFQMRLLKIVKKMNKNDVIRTVTEFTAYSIWYNYHNFIESKTAINELIVSGGGAENPVLMKSLKSYFKGVVVRKMNDFGITTDNKEAVLFALLANECISGNSANMPAVTGSKKEVILGKICLA